MIVYHLVRTANRHRELMMECSVCGAEPIDIPHRAFHVIQVCPYGCVSFEETIAEHDNNPLFNPKLR